MFKYLYLILAGVGLSGIILGIKRETLKTFTNLLFRTLIE